MKGIHCYQIYYNSLQFFIFSYIIRTKSLYTQTGVNSPICKPPSHNNPMKKKQYKGRFFRSKNETLKSGNLNHS